MKFLTSLTLIVATILFFAVNSFSRVALPGAKLDLTEGKLYTLSDGTRNIVKNLQEPVTLKLYFSRDLAEDAAQPYLTYERRVRELLESFEGISDKVSVETINTESFSETEDEAVAYGLQGMRANQAGDLLFFGIAGVNAVDDVETLPVLNPGNDDTLEFELAKMVHKLGNPELPIIGILSSLPLEGQPNPQNPAQPAEPWAMLQFINQGFETQMLTPGLTEIPEEVDVLMVVHPKGFSDETLYAIDQYALSGKNLLAFVDPHCLFEPDPPGQRPGMGGSKASEFDALLGAWGLELVPSTVVGDTVGAKQMPSQSGNRFTNPLFFGNSQPNVSDSDFVTKELGEIVFLFPGALKHKENSQVTVEPLCQTSAEGSGTLDASHLQFGQPDFENLASMFAAGGGAQNLAVRLSGTIQTAYPDGPPGDPAEEAGDEETAEDPAEEDDAEGEGEESETEEESSDHLTESASPFNAIVVADADIIAEAIWAQRQNFFGQIRINAIASNGSFVLNALENLTGSNDLISLRSRQGIQRPFEVREEMMKEADDKFRAKYDELNTELEETQARLTELQQPAEGAVGNILLTAEQEAEIEQYNDKRVEIRKELREVRRSLNADIKALGTRLKWANTALVPIALLLLGLIVSKGRG